MEEFNSKKISRHLKDKSKKVPAWLLTFTDIMALMLTFFVLLYAMSVPEVEKWEDISSALNAGVSKFKSARAFKGSEEDINIDKLDFSRALNLDYLESVMNDLIEKDERLENIVVTHQKDHLILSLPVDLLFKSGKTDIGTQGKRALFAVGGPLSRIRNRIEVVGHTDPVPINRRNVDLKSNWTLSLVRAAQVAALLDSVGYERNIVVRGMSSARYEELPSDMDKERRKNLARRVDIVIMKDDGGRQKFLQAISSG